MPEKPPVFSKWNYWYAVVIGNLLMLILLFYIFTSVFE